MKALLITAALIVATSAQAQPAHFLPAFGRTPAEVQAQFNANMDRFLADPANLKRVSQPELCAIKQYAKIPDGFSHLAKNPTWITACAKGTLRVKYMRAPHARAGSLDFTLYEIYLDFLTEGAGMSASAALAQTAIYASANLGLAWSAGLFIGESINQAIDAVSPETNEAIGAAVNDAKDNFIQLEGNFPDAGNEHPVWDGSPAGGSEDAGGDSHGFYISPDSY